MLKDLWAYDGYVVHALNEAYASILRTVNGIYTVPDIEIQVLVYTTFRKLW